MVSHISVQGAFVIKTISRKFAYPTFSEGISSASLQSRRQVCLLSSKIEYYPPGQKSGGFVCCPL